MDTIELVEPYILVPLFLQSLFLERIGCENTRAEAGARATLAITLTLTFKFQQYKNQHVGLNELYLVIYSLWRLNTAVRTYIALSCTFYCLPSSGSSTSFQSLGILDHKPAKCSRSGYLKATMTQILCK